MVKTTQNLWKKTYHNIFGQVLLGLCGSEAAIAVFRPVNPGSNPVVGKDFFKLV